MKWKLLTRKVYPNATTPTPTPTPTPDDAPMVVLTVWKKSLLLNCDGFTVFDCRGNLVYRVDNYRRSSADGEIHLMDASGNSLLTIRRRKKLMASGNNTWSVFDREMSDSPRLLVERKNSAVKIRDVRNQHPDYEIEGCYGRRRCAVYDENRGRVAEIKPKEASVKGVAFGNDVFRLLVRPDFEAALAMAVVLILDRF